MATQKAQKKAARHRKLASAVQLGQTADSVLVTGVTHQPDGVRIHYALGSERTPEPTEDVPEPVPEFVRRGQIAHVLDAYADFEAELPASGDTWERYEAAALARLRAMGRITDLEGA